MRAATAIVARARYHTMARPAEHECLFTGTFRLDRTRIAPGVARTVPPADAVAALSAAGATTRALVVHSGNPALLGGGGTAVAASTLLSAPLAPTLEALGVPLADALAATSPAATCIVLGVHDADGASWAIIDVTGGGSEAEVAAKLAPVAGVAGATFANARDLFFGAMLRGAAPAPGARPHSGDGATAAAAGAGAGAEEGERARSAGAGGPAQCARAAPSMRRTRPQAPRAHARAMAAARTTCAMAAAAVASDSRCMVGGGATRRCGARGDAECGRLPVPAPPRAHW